MPGWGSDDIAALEWADPPRRWQRSLRWQKPERDGRRLLVGLIVGLLCTALPIVMFDRAMRVELRRLDIVARDAPIFVELLTEPEIAPAPLVDRPVAEPSTGRSTARERRSLPVEAPSPPSVTGTAEPVAPQPAAPLQLFGQDGSIRLPAESPGRKTFGALEGRPLAHENPLPYEATRFDRMMPPVRESLGAELVRKTTWTRTWHTRSGTRIQCVTSLVMAGLGICGWGVEPRATADELRAMRADPPLPGAPKPDDAQ
jgi:hypothetical protein